MDERSSVADSTMCAEEDPSLLEEGRGRAQEKNEKRDFDESAPTEVSPVHLASREEKYIAVAAAVARKAARRLANKGINNRAASDGAPSIKSAAVKKEDVGAELVLPIPAMRPVTSIEIKEFMDKKGLKRAPDLDTPAVITRAYSVQKVNEPGAEMVLPHAFASEQAGVGEISTLTSPASRQEGKLGSKDCMDKTGVNEVTDLDIPGVVTRLCSTQKVEEPRNEMVLPGAFSARERSQFQKYTSNEAVPGAFAENGKGFSGKESKYVAATMDFVPLALASGSTESLPGAFAGDGAGAGAREGKAQPIKVPSGEAGKKKAPAGEARKLPESAMATAGMGYKSESGGKMFVPGAVAAKGRGLRSKESKEKPGLKKAPAAETSAVPPVGKAIIPLMVDASEGSVPGAVAATGRGLRSKESKKKPGLKKAPAGPPVANMADESESSVPGAHAGLRRTTQDQRIKRAAIATPSKTDVGVAPLRCATVDTPQEESDSKSSFQQGTRSSDQSQPGAIPQMSEASLGVGEEDEIVHRGESKHSLRTSQVSKALLIEAKLVTEDSRLHDLGDIVEAEAMTSADVLVDFLKSPRGIATVIFSLAAIAGIVTGLVLGLFEMQNTTETLRPSEVPSASPTLAPTVEFGLEVLPSSTVEKIENFPDSPQAKAFQWVLEDPFLQEMPPARKMRRFALATLYYATNGYRWVRSDNWLSYDHSECEWFQRSMEQVCGELTLRKLSLPKNGLSGTLPMEVALIEGLEQLDLSENYAEGQIPSGIGMLSDSLEILHLNGNLLGYSIPTEVGHLTNLKELNLANGYLRGSVPSQTGNLIKLIDMDLQGNSLTGPLPSEFGKLSTMRTFDASENYLSGFIPTEFGMITGLGTLKLKGNDIKGNIISEIGLLKELSAIDLSYCLLTGTLPTHLGNLDNLRSLHLVGGDKEKKLKGSIPSELGRLSRLRALLLDHNGFTGSLPTEMGNLSILLDLSVTSNSIIGTLPDELGLLTLLQYFGVGENKLTGTLPSQLGRLLQLNDLSLSDNEFTGYLPSEVLNLQLEILDIDRTNITVTGHLLSSLPKSLKKLHFEMTDLDGPLPAEISRLTNLEYLDGHFSGMTGTIPSTIGLMTSLTHLDLFDNILRGPVPSEIGLLQGLSYLDLEDNYLSGEIPTEFFQLSRLNEIFLDSNELTGAVPSAFCELPFEQFDADCMNVSCSCCYCSDQDDDDDDDDDDDS